MKETFKDIFNTIITTDQDKKEFATSVKSIKSPINS